MSTWLRGESRKNPGLYYFYQEGGSSIPELPSKWKFQQDRWLYQAGPVSFHQSDNPYRFKRYYEDGQWLIRDLRNNSIFPEEPGRWFKKGPYYGYPLPDGSLFYWDADPSQEPTEAPQASDPPGPSREKRAASPHSDPLPSKRSHPGLLPILPKPQQLGTAGSPLSRLQANAYKFANWDRIRINVYNVTIEANKEFTKAAKKRIVRQMYEVHKASAFEGCVYAFDGEKKLLTSKKIIFPNNAASGILMVG